MSHDDKISVSVRAAQQALFRKTDAALKVIAADSGLGYTTLQSYARGESVMSVASLHRLMLAGLSTELLSLLLPDGFSVVAVPEGVDHDGLAAACLDYAKTHMEARHPDSPGGVQIVAVEASVLDMKAAGLKGRAA